MLREAWKHQPFQHVSSLDVAVAKSGLTRQEYHDLAYSIPARQLQRCRRSRQGVQLKAKKRGRPSKVRNPKCIEAVRSALEKNSTAAEWGRREDAQVEARTHGFAKHHLQIEPRFAAHDELTSFPAHHPSALQRVPPWQAENGSLCPRQHKGPWMLRRLDLSA